jgi:hypothetical protein
MPGLRNSVNTAWAKLDASEAVYQWLDAFGSRGATPREISTLLLEREYPWALDSDRVGAATTARVRLEMHRLEKQGRVVQSSADPVRYAQARRFRCEQCDWTGAPAELAGHTADVQHAGFTRVTA